MTTETNAYPFDWIKQLPLSILQSDEVPLFGHTPPFPWENLGHELSTVFHIDNIRIQPSEHQWQTPDQLLANMPDAPLLLCSFAPLEGALIWAMSNQDIEILMKHLLAQQADEFASIDPDFQKGFYKFLAAQVIQTINKLDFDRNLSPTLHESDISLPDQPAFCIDVTISIGESTAHGRAIIPNALRQSWKERYADRKLGLAYDNPLSQKVQAIVHLEAGKVELTPDELSKIRPGDFIVLDTCSFDLESDKGRIIMTANGVPLFRARLKHGSIKILEFPFYHEVDTSMKNDKDDDEFEDAHESELEEFDDEEESLEEEEEQDEVNEGEFAEEEHHDLEKQDEPKPNEKIQKNLAAADKPPLVDKNKGINPAELPVTIIIELGRVQISIQKLMELQPGNTLDLDIHPENGVDLVVNGRRIGKGELLKAGETLGIRVLDIG